MDIKKNKIKICVCLCASVVNFYSYLTHLITDKKDEHRYNFILIYFELI